MFPVQRCLSGAYLIAATTEVDILLLSIREFYHAAAEHPSVTAVSAIWQFRTLKDKPNFAYASGHMSNAYESGISRMNGGDRR